MVHCQLTAILLFTSKVHSGSGHLNWFQSADANPLSTYSLKVLCCATSTVADLSLPTNTFRMLVISLVLKWVNPSNSVLVSLPVYLVHQFQSMLNAAARLACHLRTTSPMCCMPPLAARAEASPVQDFRSALEVLACIQFTILWSAQLQHQLAWPLTALFCCHQPSSSVASQVDYHRQPSFLGCRP